MAFTLVAAQGVGTSTAKQFPTEHDKGRIPKRFSYTVYYRGTFGGGDVKLQASDNNTDFADVPNSTFTAAATFNIEFYGNHLRVVVAAGGSPVVDVVLV